MTAYAVGHLYDPRPHEDVCRYLEEIQATLDPFGGRFLVHGAETIVREGSWRGTLVVIGFPSLDHARDWYDSPAYRAILPLRADHIAGDILLVGGCDPETHDSAAMGAAMRRLLAAA